MIRPELLRRTLLSPFVTPNKNRQPLLYSKGETRLETRIFRLISHQHFLEFKLIYHKNKNIENVFVSEHIIRIYNSILY